MLNHRCIAGFAFVVRIFQTRMKNNALYIVVTLKTQMTYHDGVRRIIFNLLWLGYTPSPLRTDITILFFGQFFFFLSSLQLEPKYGK